MATSRPRTSVGSPCAPARAFPLNERQRLTQSPPPSDAQGRESMPMALLLRNRLKVRHEVGCDLLASPRTRSARPHAAPRRAAALEGVVPGA